MVRSTGLISAVLMLASCSNAPVKADGSFWLRCSAVSLTETSGSRPSSSTVEHLLRVTPDKNAVEHYFRADQSFSDVCDRPCQTRINNGAITVSKAGKNAGVPQFDLRIDRVTGEFSKAVWIDHEDGWTTIESDGKCEKIPSIIPGQEPQKF